MLQHLYNTIKSVLRIDFFN